MRVGTAQGVDAGQSSRDAVKLLKSFLERAEETSLLSAIPSEVWDDFQTDAYDDAITGFTRTFFVKN